MTPRSSLTAAVIACSLLTVTAARAQAPAPVALTVHAVKDGKVYWIEGGGGNSGVIIGDSGVLVIDAKISPEAGKALIDAVAKLTPKPITHLIETHSDGDHINGSVAFPASVKVVAHVNNLKEQIIEPLFASVEVGGGKCLPPVDRLPTVLVQDDKLATTLDGEKVEFHHFGPAHTTGDLIVYLPAYKVAFTGDILTANVLVHPEKHGSFAGWFKTARGLLDLPATTYIPGHAAQPDTKAMLRQRIADLQSQKDRIDAMVRAGKTLAEVKAAMGDGPDRPGCRGIPYPSVAWDEYQDETQRLQSLK